MRNSGSGLEGKYLAPYSSSPYLRLRRDGGSPTNMCAFSSQNSPSTDYDVLSTPPKADKFMVICHICILQVMEHGT